MSELFLQILNIGIMASWLVLAVLVARVLLKKAPAWIRCSLWAIVALRLSEECVISMGPTSGIFTISILAWEDGVCEYSEVVQLHFNSGFAFQVKDGILQIVGSEGSLLYLQYADGQIKVINERD